MEMKVCIVQAFFFVHVIFFALLAREWKHAMFSLIFMCSSTCLINSVNSHFFPRKITEFLKNHASLILKFCLCHLASH